MTEHKRIKVSELEKSIFRPNDNVSMLDSDNSIDPITIVYTIAGKQDEFDENGLPVLHDTVYERQGGDDRIIKAETLEDGYAKKTFNGNRYRYYVKMSNRGHFFNPNGAEEWNQKKTRQTGELVWKFGEVNLRVFELYTSFLKTNNIAWLRNAERAFS